MNRRRTDTPVLPKRGPIVVSIVSHGQADLMAGLLEDIARFWRHDDITLVLTFNLPEPVPEIVDRLPMPVIVLHNESPKGFAENHNTAFMQRESDHFCVLNPDIRCCLDPLDDLLQAMRPDDVAMAAPRIVDQEGRLQDSARRRITPWRIAARVLGWRKGPDYVLGKDVIYPDWVAGMFLLVRSSVYARLGGFDERFHLYCEDADLCMRARRLGYRTVQVPGTRVVHDARRSSHRQWRYLSWHLSSLARVMWRYPLQPRLPKARPDNEPGRRLAVVAGSYIAQRDGISVYTENLLRALLGQAGQDGGRLRLDVFVPAAVRARLAEQVEVAGCPGNVSIRYLQVAGRVPGWMSLRVLANHLRRRYDLVLLPNLQPLYLPMRSASVLHDMTYRVAPTRFPRWRRVYMDLLTRWRLRQDEVVATISESTFTHLRRFHASAGTLRRCLMPNGVPGKLAVEPRLSEIEGEAKWGGDRLDVLFVGRLNRLKGGDRLPMVCRALQQHAARFDAQVTVHIVGKATTESDELLAAVGRHDRVRLRQHGYIGDAALNSLYRECGYCLFLSRNEGFGLPLIEALWQRTVPLLSDIPIFREVMGRKWPLVPDDAHAGIVIQAVLENLHRDAGYRQQIMTRMEHVLAHWADGYERSAQAVLSMLQEGREPQTDRHALSGRNAWQRETSS